MDSVQKFCRKATSGPTLTRFTQTLMEANSYSLTEEENLVPAQAALPNVFPPLLSAVPL